MKRAGSITELIGRTPLVRLNQVSDESDAEVLGKLESFNPGGSVKDRIGLADDRGGGARRAASPPARRRSSSRPPATPASGWRWSRRPRLRADPDDARHVSASSGARCSRPTGRELRLTPAAEGMRGAVERAAELALARTRTPSCRSSSRTRPTSPLHYRTTAREIWRPARGPQLGRLRAGVGTGGTITGVGRVLRELRPDVRIVAVEPEKSAGALGRPAGRAPDRGHRRRVRARHPRSLRALGGTDDLRSGRAADQAGAGAARGAAGRHLGGRLGEDRARGRARARDAGQDGRHHPLRHRREVLLDRLVRRPARRALVSVAREERLAPAIKRGTPDTGFFTGYLNNGNLLKLLEE